VTPRSAIVGTALSQVGTTERPPGSNRTPYGAWYGLNGQPWCAVFVAWCFARLGHDLRAELTPEWAYTPAGLAAGRRAGWAVRHQDARPGDIVFFNFPGGEAVDHVGIVESNVGGVLRTIEGNTSPGPGTFTSQANGGGVWRRWRDWSLVAGVLSPPYLTDAVQPAPPPAPPTTASTTTTPEDPMFLVVDNVGFFAVGPGPIIVGLSITEYAQAVENSRGVPIKRLPQGPGQKYLEQTLKAMAKAVS
jgi:hypothetical protein